MLKISLKIRGLSRHCYNNKIVFFNHIRHRIKDKKKSTLQRQLLLVIKFISQHFLIVRLHFSMQLLACDCISIQTPGSVRTPNPHPQQIKKIIFCILRTRSTYRAHTKLDKLCAEHVIVGAQFHLLMRYYLYLCLSFFLYDSLPCVIIALSHFMIK